MCTLPLDIIGKIANNVTFTDIISFLISSKDLSNLINKDLANKLSEIYNLPFVSDFQQLLYYSRFDQKKLIQLSLITDDLRIFKAHHSKDYSQLLSEGISEYGSMKICYYLLENLLILFPYNFSDIIRQSVKQDQYILMSRLLDRNFEKLKTENTKIPKDIYLFVRSFKMIKLLMLYLPLDTDNPLILKNAMKYCDNDGILFLLENKVYYSGYLFDEDSINNLFKNYDKEKEIILKIFNILVKNSKIYISIENFITFINYGYDDINDILLRHFDQQLLNFKMSEIFRHVNSEEKQKLINFLLIINI